MTPPAMAAALHGGEQPVRGRQSGGRDEVGNQRLDGGVKYASRRTPEQRTGNGDQWGAGERQNRHGGYDEGRPSRAPPLVRSKSQPDPSAASASAPIAAA